METKYTTLIERYFDQLLSPEEIAEIEQLKKTDSDFLQEFELFKKTYQAVELSTVINLKAEIKGIHQKMDSPTKSAKIVQLRWIGIAASILLLAGFGFYAQQFSNQNLYSEAFTPVGDYVTNMDNDLSALEKAMEMFNKQQFDSASQLFHKIYATTGSQVALFYEGHTYYQTGRLQHAIKILNKVSNNYKPEAQWYVSLAYLKMEDNTNTIKTLNAIINDNQDEAFVIKAKKLKGQLTSPLRKLVF